MYKILFSEKQGYIYILQWIILEQSLKKFFLVVKKLNLFLG